MEKGKQLSRREFLSISALALLAFSSPKPEKREIIRPIDECIGEEVTWKDYKGRLNLAMSPDTFYLTMKHKLGGAILSHKDWKGNKHLYGVNSNGEIVRVAT